jgi:hypothetical protein
LRWGTGGGAGGGRTARPGPVLVLLPIATCWGRHRLRLAVDPFLTLALRRVFTRHTTQGDAVTPLPGGQGLVSFLTAPEWTSTNDSEEQMNFSCQSSGNVIARRSRSNSPVSFPSLPIPPLSRFRVNGSHRAGWTSAGSFSTAGIPPQPWVGDRHWWPFPRPAIRGGRIAWSGRRSC